jgi:hypothetical protein
MVLDREIRWPDPRASVRTAVWSLLPLSFGCASQDPNADALVDGCWGRYFSEDYLHDEEPDWEPLDCSLPIICEPIDISVAVEYLTPEQAAAVDASARCMLEALRDGIPAVHHVASSPDGGAFSDRMAYSVLPDGVVGFDDWNADLGYGMDETYRQTRDDAFFDECLAQVEPPLGCLVGRNFPPLVFDVDGCIDAAPRCPD